METATAVVDYSDSPLWEALLFLIQRQLDRASPTSIIEAQADLRDKIYNYLNVPSNGATE